MSADRELVLFSLWIASFVSFLQGETIEGCNKTVDYEKLINEDSATTQRRVTLSLGETAGQKPLYCWVKLEGKIGQYVELDVKTLHAGNFDNATKSCKNGYLRLSEEEAAASAEDWPPPTEICGHYNRNKIRVKRLTRDAFAFVEFRVDDPSSEKDYEIDALFLDKEPEHQLPYGHIQRQEGRIKNTDCDWTIPVETCYAYCYINSPGYPGMYPPNTRCRYQLENFDDGRVEVLFGGANGKFDLKKSIGCEEDYLLVYDGLTSASPLLGKYCGLDSDHIISSGPTLLLEFVSGSGGPPWDHSGFNIQVTERWKNYANGEQEHGTKCDWVFHSDQTSEEDENMGELNTPDHMVYPNTTCNYVIEGNPHERIKVTVKSSTLLPDCVEMIEIFDDDKRIDTICKNRITNPRGTAFTYSSTTNRITIRYHSKAKIISTPNPTYIDYEFINSTEALTENDPPLPAKERLDADDSSGTAACYANIMISSSLYIMTQIIKMFPQLLV